MKNFKQNNNKKNKTKKKFESDDPKEATDIELKKSAVEDAEIEKLKKLYETFDSKEVKKFHDFPISKKTLKGLNENSYVNPTVIQKEAIGHGLKGSDVLGSAITGSGKTLAFLVPILENLYINKWSRMDGLGALIISPTRELAYQIFETLRKIGIYHEFSAALIIGGKNLKFERRRMDQCNIIICTPGRLLQHMDENPLFNCSNLQILVLDEADRILDLGFEQTMNAIIDNFPPNRQTLLFSATQTKSVRDLARLSLTSPVYIAPHSESAHATPINLQQNYVIIEAEDKITMLWSFIKNHLKQKTIVFMSSCKQVKFVTEMFTKLRLGTTILGLYGTLHQDRRVAIYEEFVRKSNAVLVCTDIASRGLDFPTVNWVVQLDCPEDATAYIHRAGRTARHKQKGESLLVLIPSEEETMIQELAERKIPINKIFVDPKKMFSPRVKMEGILAQNLELKATAQRAFVSYIKSIALMKNKKVFNPDSINADAFARSFGLVVTPRIRFLERKRKEKNNVARDDEGQSQEEDDENVINEKHRNPVLYNFGYSDDESDNETDFLKVKRRNHNIDGEDLSDSEKEEEPVEIKISKKKLKPITKIAVAKKIVKKKIKVNTKMLFDEDGNEVLDPTKTIQSDLAKDILENDDDESGGINIEKSKLLLREEDHFDKKRFKEMVRQRHREQKRKLKQKVTEDKDEQEQDDFGSDNESDDGPDLSWLPDPDKVYANKSKSISEEISSDNDEKLVKNLKRKKKHNIVDTSEKLGIQAKKRKKLKIDTNDLSVNEAEMMAMKLLGV